MKRGGDGGILEFSLFATTGRVVSAETPGEIEERLRGAPGASPNEFLLN